jgi:sialate O-acetylesterase
MKNLKLCTKTIFIIPAIVILLITSCNTESKSTINLSQLFSNHMVIQRNKEIHIFGTATPGIKIDAELAGNKSNVKVDKDGKFNMQLPELKAGGPYELLISTKDTIIKLNDILIGDVWVCSGQSNMEFLLKDSKNAKQTIENPRSDQIRVIDVPHDVEFKPQSTFRNKMEWYSAESDSIQNFSAVAYYFAAELQHKLNIPIGLIGSNWGGTNVETWTQIQALDRIPQFKDKIDYVKNSAISVKKIEEKWLNKFEQEKEKLFVNGIGVDEKWYLPTHDTSDWNKITVPGFWEDQIPEMKEFDGVVWYRKEFDLTKDFAGKDMQFWLSQIHDYDITWMNGIKIGETYSPYGWRGYTVKDSILKEKNNVLVVRVYNRKNKGGFAGIPAYFDYYPVYDKTQKGSTSGEWSYKIAKAVKDTLDLPLSSESVGPNDYPSLLYNAMINPMIQFPIKGAIWYQGEANAGKAYLYRKTFPAMINNWRQQWNIGDFPFYFVQLADFGPENDKFGDSFWAELRQAQTITLSLPNTGMATTIDIGNPTDIHPLNKKDVGLRLAYNALHKTYGIETLYSGPVYNKYTIHNKEIIIEFEHLGSGLITDNEKAPQEFILAGEDQVFYPATAKIVNNTIVVSSKKIAKPVSVRYAWKNSPKVNLFNKEGLPAVPFRTDKWKGITYKNSDY